MPVDTEKKTWDEVGLEAMPGWVICRPIPGFDGRKPGSVIEIVSREPNLRPTVVEVLVAGPPRPDAKGRSYFVPLQKGDRILVPEYGVKIHEDAVLGDLRCYEYSQIQCKIVTPPATERATERTAKK